MARRLCFAKDESAERLGAADIFAGADRASLAALAEEVMWTGFEPGEHILSHMDDSADFFILSEGEIEARLESPSGRGVLVRRLRAGAHFGELAPLTGAKRSVTLVALGAVVAGSLGEPVFKRLLREQAPFGARLAIDLAHSVVRLTEQVYELAALEMRFRLYGQLLRLANGAPRAGEAFVIHPAPTHAELAQMIGAQREAVTRELNYLAREGIVRSERSQIVILDMARLTDMFAKRAGPSPHSAPD